MSNAQELTAQESIIVRQTQDGRIHCPYCSHERKKSHLKTCSITVEHDRVLYDCHHCGAGGMVPFESAVRAGGRKVTPIPTNLKRRTSAVVEFFAGRGVGIEDMSALPQIVTGTKFFHEVGQEVPAIGFVYGDRENPEAIKWRALGYKAFTQDGRAASFYGLERLREGDKDLYIVEGEADVVALATLGIRAVSVPNGAPAKLSNRKARPQDDKKFSYLWDAKDLLDSYERVILAVDQDEPGDALVEEIGRRLGRAKCWRPTYPDDCKDVTDVLKKYGADTVREVLEKAQPLPLQGIYMAKDYAGQLNEVYRDGLAKGLSTGYACVDNLFTVNPGRLTIVTGYPGSGKSEFVDQIAVNLARNEQWKFAVASFENPPHIHIAKLAEKVVGKPFHDGPTPRMTESELMAAVEYIDDHFTFLESKDGNLPTIESIIDRTKQAVLRLGVRGLIVDPYNYIHKDHNLPEYEWISQILTQMSHFAKSHDLHIWFIAHPQKIQPNESGQYPVPKGQQISGSAAWFSKADIGFTVHRSHSTEIHCWKVRFKWEGQIGQTILDYDIVTGRYSEPRFRPKMNEEWAPPTHWQDDSDRQQLGF